MKLFRSKTAPVPDHDLPDDEVYAPAFALGDDGAARAVAAGGGTETAYHGGEGWLTAYGVQKSYKNRKVVKGVSLAVARGESVGLLGPNGAGKTTTFYMITGLVPADDGRITINGRDVTRLPMYRRARLGIGYLPQEASIFRGLSVEQNIMAVLELVEPKKKKRKEKLDELLEEFKITRLRKSPSMALSGGSGGAARLPAHWHLTLISCSSTSRLPVSTRWRSAISKIWCGI